MILKVSYSLNPYNGFFDVSSDKGIKLMHKALEDFSSEHKGKIKLEPECADFLVGEIKLLSERFGYRYLIDNVPTERVVIPANADDEDSVETVEYRNKIKMLDHFSEDNVLVAQQNATVLWGSGSWNHTTPKTIRPL